MKIAPNGTGLSASMNALSALKNKPIDVDASESLNETEEKPSFSNLVAQEIGKVIGSAENAQNEIEKFQQNPQEGSIERTAFLMAQAESELKTAVQIRNKAVSAYQEIMNMQI